MTARTPTGRVLVRCLRQAEASTRDPELGADLASVDLDLLVREGIRHRVGGALLASLREVPGLPAEPIERLRSSVTRSLTWQMVLVHHMHRVTEALQSVHVPHVVLKGPALASHAYRDATWRSFADLDVLVTSTDARAARSAMEQMGAFVPDIQRSITARGLDGEIALFLGSGVNLDLHHELVNDAEVRSSFAVPIGELLMRRRAVMIDGRPTCILDPVDQLLHLCLHGAVSNGRKLVWLLDIDQAVRNDPFDAEVLVHRARRWKVGLVAAVMLERARHVLETPVSDELLAELAPGEGWRRLCHTMMSLRPPDIGSHAVLGGGVVMACTRDTTRASGRALVRAVWREGVREPVRNPEHPWRQRFRAA